jgi:hypothetical protein
VGELNRRAADAEARAAELDTRLQGYRALSLLHQTIMDLDAQNYGVANTRLDEVVTALGQVGQGAAGEVEAIRNELAGLDIRLDTDLAGQRATLSDLVRRLAQALGG